MHIHDTTNTSLPMRLHQHFPNLTSLRVELTDLNSIDKEAAAGMKNLKNLCLGNNKIENVFKDTFEELSLLRHLYLNRNKIKKIEKGTFDKLRNLERLWLNNNEIHELHSELLAQNQNLKLLYLQNNRIAVIGKETFAIPSLQIVDLRRNVCINKSTFDTRIDTVKQMVGSSCVSEVESMRKSSIVMAKIIHELSFRDISLYNEIAAYQEIACELNVNLLKQCKDDHDNSLICQIKEKLLRDCGDDEMSNEI